MSLKKKVFLFISLGLISIFLLAVALISLYTPSLLQSELPKDTPQSQVDTYDDAMMQKARTDAEIATNNSAAMLACTYVNTYLKNFFEVNDQYPDTLEQWLPSNVARTVPKYSSPTYKKTSPTSFVYDVPLGDSDRVTFTEKDIISAPNDEMVDSKCKELLLSSGRFKKIIYP